MAKKREQPTRQKKLQAETPSKDDFFATPVSEPVYGDIFSSLLDLSAEPNTGNAGTPPSDIDPVPVPHPKGPRLSPGRFSYVQALLLIGIVAVASLLAYTVVKKLRPTSSPGQPSSRKPSPRPAMPPQRAVMDMLNQQLSETATPTATATANAAAPPMPTPAPLELNLPRPEPLSLRIAEKFYLSGDIENANITYDKLFRRLPVTDDNQPLRDFLLLRMALCNRRGGNTEQADTMFRAVALSRLPILRALARYHQSITLIGRERYVEAATKASQTLGLIGVVDYDKKWASAVQRQCYILIAESVTRNLLSLRDADGDLPAQLWSQHPDIDPFAHLDEPQLKIFLASGLEALDAALLSPQISPVADTSSVPHWSVVCNGASIEELLARFAANAKLDVRWSDESYAPLAETSARRRPVYLSLASATAQQVVTIAAGSVGLLARMTEAGTVHVVDPSSYTSLADHSRMLADEAVTLWQRFLLTAEADTRIANAHFALGLVHATQNRLDEAIAEYKLVANRFSKHVLAPYGLLSSGKLKVQLRDYVGAHQDLKELVDLYPETELADRAALNLADTTMKAGLYEEATGLYRKVYNLGLSNQSQIASSLGAGQCAYETGDYEAAAQWLNRYVTLCRKQNRREFHAACLLLGKTYLALHKPLQANVALNLALKGELSQQQHVETVIMLVKAYIEQERFVEALDVLESAQAWQLSQQETINLLLLRARVLRSIGLTERAISLLKRRSAFLPDPELKGQLTLELARCYVESGSLASARKALSESFAVIEPGDIAQQLGCELADICLRLGQPKQAASVCSQLLKYAPAGPRRQRIVNMLAKAYRRQKQYDRAVLALMDQGNRATYPNAAPPASGATTSEQRPAESGS